MTPSWSDPSCRLSPRCWPEKSHFCLGKPIFPNLFSLVVTPSGLRKSTSIDLTEHIVQELLADDRILSGLYSEQSLFNEYYDGPADKIWIEDDANPILRNWAYDAAGKHIPDRMLKIGTTARAGA